MQNAYFLSYQLRKENPTGIQISCIDWALSLVITAILTSPDTLSTPSAHRQNLLSMYVAVASTGLLSLWALTLSKNWFSF